MQLNPIQMSCAYLARSSVTIRLTARPLDGACTSYVSNKSFSEAACRTYAVVLVSGLI